MKGELRSQVPGDAGLDSVGTSSNAGSESILESLDKGDDVDDPLDTADVEEPSSGYLNDFLARAIGLQLGLYCQLRGISNGWRLYIGLGFGVKLACASGTLVCSGSILKYLDRGDDLEDSLGAVDMNDMRPNKNTRRLRFGLNLACASGKVVSIFFYLGFYT
ncbi:unnamed protein product [Dovyalis caffra]|uniref:Uncharacterized protein n=1 Tax=Dovyalis caffra TaxID=77055 RepID=A0AAV1QQ75_9ROSI|nr:unnamed protein product [Dovyalis caffra]